MALLKSIGYDYDANDAIGFFVGPDSLPKLLIGALFNVFQMCNYLNPSFVRK